MKAILTSKNFELIKKSGLGIENTPWTGLEVESKNIAKKHVVEVRLKSDFPDFEGKPVQYKYSRAYVVHGMRMKEDSLKETLEYIDVLKEAVKFSEKIEKWMDKNPQWKRDKK